MKRLILLAGSLAYVMLALAQGSLEVLPLKHRSAEQVMPVLRPLLDSGGTLSGQGYQLFVRTNARNLADLKRALAAIDTPQRRLLISVRFESSADAASSGGEVRGVARSGDASSAGTSIAHPGAPPRVEARVLSSRNASDERVDQRLQVLEGAKAFISTGHSRPLPQRQVISGSGGTIVQDVTLIQPLETGFEVVPRVSGSMVFLDISPRREVPGALGAGSVQSQQASTSVSAPLGEWVELGSAATTGGRGVQEAGARGAAGGARPAAGGSLSSREARVDESRRIWVRVEELRP